LKEKQTNKDVRQLESCHQRRKKNQEKYELKIENAGKMMKKMHD
jgi:hypothetical protein